MDVMKPDEAITRILTHLGIPVVKAGKRVPAWDGKAINMSTVGRQAGRVTSRPQYRLSGMVHEIGHWLVASPEHRLLPNYGLGGGPDDGPIACRRANKVADELEAARGYVDDDEELASALGILIEECIGMDWHNTFEYHGWVAAEFAEEKKTLRKRGLVDKHGIPVVLMEAGLA